MTPFQRRTWFFSLAAALWAHPSAFAQPMHGHHAPASPPATDARVAVAYPAAMREHTLASMRDHLLALAQIQEALAEGRPEQAALIAEQRLGMGALKAHHAHEASQLMPEGMRQMGSAMHHSASEFALQAQNAAATGDLKPALAALAQTTQACVACHASYRLH